MANKTVLTLGGGVGGMVVANELRRLLPSEHRVVLVEKNAQHAYAPSFLWLMTGDRKPEQITCDVHRLLRSGIEVVQSEVHSIDVANRTVQAGGQRLTYDYLVIALGATLAPEAIPGLSGGGHTFYTLNGAMELRDALSKFRGGTVAVVVGALPYKCPGAPHEGAMLIANLLRRRGLQSEVHLFTPETQPMPVAGPDLGEAVKQMLTDRSVEFHARYKVIKVDPVARELSFDGNASFRYDLLVTIPPHRGPQIVRDAGLANDAGLIPVDRMTLQTKYENVFALGDVTAISIPGRWKSDVPLMLPKAGVFAHAQAEAVAHRIASEIDGAHAEDASPGVGYCMLEAGEGLAGFAFGNFYAEPSPQIQLRTMGRSWHLGKVLFEQWWLAPRGIRREMLRQALSIGGKVLGIPVVT